MVLQAQRLQRMEMGKAGEGRIKKTSRHFFSDNLADVGTEDGTRLRGKGSFQRAC